MTILKHPLTKPKDPTPNGTLLPTLPLELRELIYAYATAPLSTHITVSAAHFIFGHDPRLPYFLPKLCHVNEAMRVEFELWFLRTREFTLLYPQHLGYFAKFLDTFPGKEGWESARRVELPLFGRNPVERGRGNEYLDFLTKCTGLTELRIKFEIWWLMKKGLSLQRRDRDGGGDEDILSRDAVVQRYGLEDIFDMPSLSTLTIEVWPKVLRSTKRGIKVEVPDCWPVMESLAAWMRKGFEERGGKVDVRVEESGNSGLKWAGGRR